MITTLLIIHGLMAVALGALLLSAVSLPLWRQRTMRMWSKFVWLVPMGGIVFSCYLLHGYFLS
jgi:peptidoglycan/LPS O-acetylase OafA/YrhL